MVRDRGGFDDGGSGLTKFLKRSVPSGLSTERIKLLRQGFRAFGA
jgi:hypothetical protein